MKHAEDYVAGRIRELEQERVILDKKLQRLRARQEVFWCDAQRLKHMHESERDQIFRKLCAEAGDAWDPLMDAMKVQRHNVDIYEDCMAIIRAQPNANRLAKEFTRSCPYLVASKIDREVQHAAQEALRVTTRLNAMYDAGIRMLDSMNVSTSASA